jgi:hypothetical protein
VTRDISRSDWPTFFETFTATHDHWLVSVDGEKETLPLEAVVVRDARIDVLLGGDVRHHRRIVIDAERVTVEQDEGLAILSTDGHTTRLRFTSPQT